MNDQDLVKQAAEWVVLLSSDENISSEIQKKFNKWKEKSKQHAKIAKEIEEILKPVQHLAQQPTKKKLVSHIVKVGLHPKNQPQKILHKYGFYILGIFSFFLFGIHFLQAYPMVYFTADVQSHAGEWKTTRLSDGSSITLRGITAINVNYTPHQRSIQLLSGEIYVDVAKDKQRPFIVQTQQGSISALGTRFIVSKKDKITYLGMLHSKVLVKTSKQNVTKLVPEQDHQSRIIQAGQQIYFNQEMIYKISELKIPQEEFKWKEHKLVIENKSLLYVLQQLDKNFKGKIFYSNDGLEHVTVNAVLPLDQTQHAMQLLSTALPQIKILEISPYAFYVSMK